MRRLIVALLLSSITLLSIGCKKSVIKDTTPPEVIIITPAEGQTYSYYDYDDSIVIVAHIKEENGLQAIIQCLNDGLCGNALENRLSPSPIKLDTLYFDKDWGFWYCRWFENKVRELRHGWNRITVEAIDSSGNIGYASVNVYREEEPPY